MTLARRALLASSAVRRGAGLASSYYDAVIADSPVAYWRLGETSGTTAADEMGVVNATYNGGPTLGATGAIAGDSNTAVTLDGTNDYMSLPDRPEWDVTTAFTLEAWVKTSSTSTGSIIDRDGSTSSHFQWRLSFDGTTPEFYGYFSGGNKSVTASVTANDGAWHHHVVTYDGANLRMYFDGAVKTTSAETRSLLTGAQPITIGRGQSLSYYLGGSMDEVAFYNSALASDRVLAHYNAGTGA